MASFYLVRHGLRVSRDEDTALSAEGIRQAEITGKYFQSKNIQQLFVSPTKRTLDTAQSINQYLHLSSLIDLRLKERMEYEPAFGSFGAFLGEWDKTMANRAYQPPYGDSSIAAGNRILRLFDELNDDREYLFVSHGGIIGDVVRNLFPDSVLSLTTDAVKNLQWLHIAECSITEIHKTDTLYILKKVNDTSHLAK